MTTKEEQDVIKRQWNPADNQGKRYDQVVGSNKIFVICLIAFVVMTLCAIFFKV